MQTDENEIKKQSTHKVGTNFRKAMVIAVIKVRVGA